jgi:hypothetical protein
MGELDNGFYGLTPTNLDALRGLTYALNGVNPLETGHLLRRNTGTLFPAIMKHQDWLRSGQIVGVTVNFLPHARQAIQELAENGFISEPALQELATQIVQYAEVLLDENFHSKIRQVLADQNILKPADYETVREKILGPLGKGPGKLAARAGVSVINLFGLQDIAKPAVTKAVGIQLPGAIYFLADKLDLNLLKNVFDEFFTSYTNPEQAMHDDFRKFFESVRSISGIADIVSGEITAQTVQTFMSTVMDEWPQLIQGIEYPFTGWIINFLKEKAGLTFPDFKPVIQKVKPNEVAVIAGSVYRALMILANLDIEGGVQTPKETRQYQKELIQFQNHADNLRTNRDLNKLISVDFGLGLISLARTVSNLFPTDTTQAQNDFSIMLDQLRILRSKHFTSESNH